MKKMIALILSAVMLTGSLPVAAAPSGSTFSDVPAGHWAAADIARAVKAGYVSGLPDGTFKPDKPVSRAEFIKMAVDALGYETSGSDGAWYTDYVNSALANGLIAPDEYGAKPDYTAAMTRQELARIAVRAIGETAKDRHDALILAVKNGMLSGTGNGELAPDGTTTRAQAVVVMERILKVNRGEKLPVDELALIAAESAAAFEQRHAFRTIGAEQPTSDESPASNAGILLNWEYEIHHTDPGVNDIAYGNRLYVAVGNDGIVKTSRDAKTWDVLKLDYDGDLAAVVWGGNQFVAVGNEGSRHTIFTSTDGLVWKNVHSGRDGSIRDLAWNGQVYAAAGTQGLILTSTDGVNWVKRDVNIVSFDSTAKQINAIEWGNGAFVAVTIYGSVLYSKDGSAWETLHLPVEYERIWDMAYGNGTFVAVGDYAIHYSKDGRNWSRLGNPKGFWSRVQFAKDRFFLSGGDYTDSTKQVFKRTYYYSRDGKAWTAFAYEPSKDQTHMRLTVHNGSEYVTIMSNGVQTSKDGVHWAYIHEYPMNNLDLKSVAHHDGQSVFVGGMVELRGAQRGSRAVFLRLDNGKWSSTVLLDQYPLNDVIWTGTRYLGVGNKGTMMVSADGLRWNPLPKVTEENLHHVKLLNNVIYVTGSGGLIMTSRDGSTWSKHETPVKTDLHAISWNGKDTWVAVGNKGLILVSNDGFTWDSVFYEATKTWHDVAWGDGRFVVVGDWGDAMTSQDGKSWRNIRMPEEHAYTHFYGIEHVGDMFVAVGMSGRIVVSRDTVEWHSQIEMTNADLYHVAEIDGMIYALGENGRLIVAGTDEGAETPQ